MEREGNVQLAWCLVEIRICFHPQRLQYPTPREALRALFKATPHAAQSRTIRRRGSHPVSDPEGAAADRRRPGTMSACTTASEIASGRLFALPEEIFPERVDSPQFEVASASRMRHATPLLLRNLRR